MAAPLVFAGSLAASACTLPSPIMVLPPELQTGGEVLSVSGRRSVHLWNHDIHFGPYRTTSTRVGWRSDDATSWGVLDDNYDWAAKQPVSFVLDAAACPRWRAQCLGKARRRLREKAVGITTGAHGLEIDRRVVEDTAEAKFECTLQPGDAPAWRLALTAADPSGFGGVLADDRGAARARVRATDRQTGEPYTYAVPSPVGFVIEGSAGNVAAVERAFEGKVILNRGTPQDQRCALATVAAALLLWEPLQSRP